MLRSRSTVVALLLSAAALLLVGCSGSGSGGVAGSGVAGNGTALPLGVSEDRETVQASVTAPPDAAFSIYCRDFTGPNHASVAETVRKQVEDKTRLRDFYVVRGPDRSVLYHGYYTTYDPGIDRREAARAKSDRELIEQIVDARGARIFPHSVFEPLERANPSAAPEWDLRNAKGYWTLLVCTYTDPVRGKQAAVDSVKEMRKNGIEAYYFFKDTQSHVCIGTWPEKAVKRGTSLAEEAERRPTDLGNPETIVVSMGEMDERWKQVRDERGRPLRLYEVRVELQDPKLREAYERYAYAVNGDFLAGEYPLLLPIPDAIGQKVTKDAAPETSGTRQPALDPLLKRY